MLIQYAYSYNVFFSTIVHEFILLSLEICCQTFLSATLLLLLLLMMLWSIPFGLTLIDPVGNPIVLLLRISTFRPSIGRLCRLSRGGSLGMFGGCCSSTTATATPTR